MCVFFLVHFVCGSDNNKEPQCQQVVVDDHDVDFSAFGTEQRSSRSPLHYLLNNSYHNMYILLELCDYHSIILNSLLVAFH